ncbi:MAG: hypothetical protein ACXVBE_17070, partial [Bdellovibrionota bacterium]
MRFFTILTLALAFSASAFAKEHKVAEAETTEVSSAHSSKPVAIGVADTTNLMGGQSLSALFATNRDWIQAYLGVLHSQGSFAFGAGGIYKFTVSGSRAVGFHVGPGVAVGTVSFSGTSV